MAKRNKIYIDVVIDDKGTTKKVALSQKQLADAAQAAGVQVGTVDRRLKGAAQASSNSTKNFSKMAQGISGGLVPAYATLAAQLFAISAAFQFLKDAGNLQTLQAGQTAYAASTGIAMRTLTNDIIAATDAQISFQDASSASAIGVAAGLSADQLTRLGAAAKSTSIILGRDVTDSFNRLVRGVTKAEPELLDELGIILRLETAFDNYKKQMNITSGELNSFQRSQAVTNEVLTQAEDKFGRILEITQVAPNNFNKLGKAFDDILITVKGFAAAVAGPFADVLIKSPKLAGAALALLIAGPLKAAIPGLQNLTERTKDLATASKESFRSAKLELEQYSKAAKTAKLLNRDEAGEYKNLAAGDARGALGSKNISIRGKNNPFKALSKDSKDITNQMVNDMQIAATKHKQIFKRMTEEERMAFHLMLEDIKIANNVAAGQVSGRWVQTGKTMSLTFKYIEVQWKAAMTRIRVAAAWAAVFVSKAFSVLGWVGIIYTLYEVAKSFFTVQEATEKVSGELELQRKKLASLVGDYKDFAAVQKILSEEGGDLLNTYQSFGQFIGSTGKNEFETYGAAVTSSVAKFAEELPKAKKELEDIQATIAKGVGFKDFSLALIPGVVGVSLLSKKLYTLGKAYYDQSDATKRAGESLDEYVERTGDKGLADYLKLLQMQKEAWAGQTDSIITASAAGNTYMQFVDQLLKGTFNPADAEAMENARVRFVEVGRAAGQARKLLDDSNDKFTTLQNKLAPTTEADAFLATIKETQEALETIERDNKAGYDELVKQTTELERQKGIIENIVTRESAAAVAAAQRQTTYTQNLVNASAFEKSILDINFKKANLQDKITEKQDENNDLLALANKKFEDLTISQREAYTIRLAETKELQAQLALEDIKEDKIRQQNRLRLLGVDYNLQQLIAQEEFLTLTKDMSQAQQGIANIEEQRRKNTDEILNKEAILNKIRVDEKGLLRQLSEEEQESVDILIAEIAIIRAKNLQLENTGAILTRNNKLQRISHRQAVEEILLSTRSKKIQAGLTDGQQRRVDVLLQQEKLQMSIRNYESEIRELSTAIKANNTNSLDTDRESLEIARLKKQESEAELGIILQTQEAFEQYRQAIAQGFESGLQQAINDLIIGAESSFKDSLLGLIDGILKSLAKKVSETITDNIIDAIARTTIGSKIFKGMTLTDDIAKGHKKGAEVAKKKIEDAGVSVADRLDNSFRNGGITLAEAISAACQACKKDEVPGGGEGTPEEKLRSLFEKSNGGNGGNPKDEGSIVRNTKKYTKREKFEQNSSDAMNDFATTVSNMVNKIVGAVKSFGSMLFKFVSSIGSIFQKFISILVSAVSQVGSAGGSALSSVISAGMSLFTGGSPVPMANGGIVSKPTYALIGEGRYSEAVIPMPNGKSVPVDLGNSRAGSNQNNNVTVNVNMGDGDSKGQSSSSSNASGQDSATLGNAIAKAVQEELQNQKRSGGILNPYGVA